jgi:probable phosphoglycerate mutase
MTAFLLIRHGAHLLGGGTIAGRMPGVHLSPLGRDQADRMAGRVARMPVRSIYCSPIDRARETAQPLADRLNLPVQVSEALSEIDFGEWAGRTLDELRPLPLWRRWNEFRSGTRAPGGESMLEVQSRVVAEVLRLSDRNGDDCVALVSHGDVIKAALAYFMGVPLDLFCRIEISLASVSAVHVGEYGPWVLGVNNTGDDLLPWPP